MIVAAQNPKGLYHVLDFPSLLKGIQPQFFAPLLITFCLDARHHLQGFLLDFSPDPKQRFKIKP
jgi:hypothetical protein